jgi:hypothetical protein
MSVAEYTREIAETAEAICGGLHRYGWELIGEAGPNNASTWFSRGEKPKIIRTEVVRSALAPMVLVNVEWYNLHTRQRGRQTLQVDVRGSNADVFMASEKAVLRCLEIFRDVLEGSGVAGPTPTTVASTDSSNVPETPEEEREAGLTDE